MLVIVDYTFSYANDVVMLVMVLIGNDLFVFDFYFHHH